MKRNYKKTILFLASLISMYVLPNICFAESLFIKAKKTKDAYILRWAPASEELWNIAKQKGFVLERYAFSSDKNFSDIVEMKKIKIQAPLSRDTNFWMQYEQDDYTMLLGQSLFGQSFDIAMQSNDSLPWKSISDRREQELSRFYFAMLAADRSFQTACIAGLAYRDTAVENKVSYLYKLYIDSDSLEQDTAIHYRVMDDWEVLPPLEKIQALSRGRKVFLRWDTKILATKYTAYFVERSKNGSVFEPCHEKPLVKWTPLGREDNTMYYEDSLPSESSSYFYRVKALDVFGDTYIASETVKLTFSKSISAGPEIDSVQEVENGDIKVYWSMEKDEEELIEFLALWTKSSMYGDAKEILRQKPKGKYFLIRSENVPSANYFFIRSRSHSGQEFVSKNYFFLRADSIAPLAPENLRAKTDSNGRIYIEWDASNSIDVAAYHIYLALGKDKPYVRINNEAVDSIFYTDSVSMNTYGLRYYKIKALDDFGNESEFSSVLSVKPFKEKLYSAPLIDVCDYDEKKAQFALGFWLDPEFSGNLFVRVRLQGKTEEDIKINAKAEQDYYTHHYFCKQSGDYEFSVYSILDNKDSLHSVNTCKIKHLSKKTAPNLRAQAHREKELLSVSWKAEEEAVYYYLYKREKGGAFSLAQKIPADQSIYVDANLRMNTIYEYILQVEFKDGSLSDYSKAISLMY